MKRLLPAATVLAFVLMLAAGSAVAQEPVLRLAKSCGRTSTPWGAASVVVRRGAVTCRRARQVARAYFRTADSGRPFDSVPPNSGEWRVLGWRCFPAEHATIGECSRGGIAIYTVRRPPKCGSRVIPRSVACRL